MSSTNAQQSAETCIANGLTFGLDDINIAAPKLNKSGGKSANILYKPSKKSLYVNMQVPMLTWGAQMFKDPQSGKETYDLALQFPRSDYSTAETDKLLAQFQALEKYIKAEAVKNCMAWFNKKMTPELVEGAWTPMLKYSKDKATGEPDLTKSPTLKVKLPQYDGKFNCEIYDTAGSMLYPDPMTESSPVELIPKGINIVAIIQCGGLWFANKAFGCTWKLFQAVVQPKPSMKGRCLITISPDTKSALTTPAAAATSANESSLVVEDDDEDECDAEPEVETPAPAPVKSAPVVVAAPVPVPVVVAAPAPVVVEEPVVAAAAAPEKKKIVKRKV